MGAVSVSSFVSSSIINSLTATHAALAKGGGWKTSEASVRAPILATQERQANVLLFPTEELAYEARTSSDQAVLSLLV